jgi:hypothetical protein
MLPFLEEKVEMNHYRKSVIFATLLLGALLVLVACNSGQQPAAQPEPVKVEVTRIVEVTPSVPGQSGEAGQPAVTVPYEDLWAKSAHNAVDSEPFRHWDEENPAEVPTSCAKCHSSDGYQDFVGADGSEANKVDKPVPAAQAQGIQCVACHNPQATNLTTVAFPGKDDEGNAIVVSGLGDAARCMNCHQGRESKASVDAQIEQFKVTDLDAPVAPIKDANGKDVNFGFRNIHYYAAAATLYDTQVKGGYEYDGKLYDAKHDHVAGFDSCIGCHDSHSLQVKVDKCAECHEGAETPEDLKNIRMPEASFADYDGDGDVEEGMFYEIQGLQEILLKQIQTYAQEKGGAEIKYDPATYPYFMGADGKAYPKWTARLLKAAYNYQVSIKDPGAFAHGNKYIVQLLHDSIEDLGGDVSKLARNDAGHFAGNTMPFRDWDAEGEVPFRCAKCHTATGLPEFLHNGGTVVFDSRGNTMTAGVGAMEPANGFQCSTCHDGANFPNRYPVTTVPFPSGASLTFSKADADGKLQPNDSNLCLECHQGRESTNSVNAALRGKDEDTVDEKISFKNIHYFAAGATLFGDAAKGLYQYEGQTYNGQYTHGDTGPTQCEQCHEVHALEVKVDKCAACHDGAEDLEGVEAIRMPSSDQDYDGDGDTTEGVKAELDGMGEALLAAIQNYATEKAGTGITYDPASHPYFYVDKDGDGKPDRDEKGATVRYNQFTPRLLKAAYNYQYSVKDPGAFAHNAKYVMQALYDSINDLGGDVSKLVRPEVQAAEQP